MFVLSKDLKIKEISKLLNNEAVEVDLSEALVNVLSNSMYFLEANQKPSEDEVELDLALTIRSMTGNDVLVYDQDNKLALTTPTLRNPFNKSMEGYFLYMYTLQHLLGYKFVYPIKSMTKTVLYPSKLVYLEGKLILTFTLFVPQDLLPKFRYKGVNKVLDLSDKDSFTCEGELDKIILATQKIVTTK